jgi:hypothetical protein
MFTGMSTKTFHGSCQCGAVKFEADVDLAQGTTKCNCTSCWKSRWWATKVKLEGFRGLAGDDQLDEKRGFCRKCGVIPYRRVEAAEWNDGAYVSVNVAALDDLDPAALLEAPVQYCNGRDNDWWHEPAVTKHL